MTPQTQFTPGPWQNCSDDHYPLEWIVFPGYADHGSIKILGHNREANARLIASAPSLYAALQAAEAWISTVLAGSNIPLDKQPFSKSVLEQAREALDLGSSTSC